ncbi:MAG: DUF1579 domain-containing protein [Planctomycetaceae bacterium]|nr:DUF1579 domain-containing protein [Planctomycetaceae bacterium]
MRPLTLLVLVLSLLAVSFLRSADPPAAAPDQAAVQEMMMKLAQPGPQHEQFKGLVGEWTCIGRSYEQNPEEPLEWKGTAEFSLLLGGRYLQQDFRGEMPGFKFEGRGITGYDNAQQKYVGTWMDTMSTGIMSTAGEFDPATNTMTEHAVSHTPAGEMKLVMTTIHKSDDAFLFTMSLDTPAGPHKMMEIDYTRKK